MTSWRVVVNRPTRVRVAGREAPDPPVSQFTSAADGVVTIDSSQLDFAQTVAAVLAVVAEARMPSGG